MIVDSGIHAGAGSDSAQISTLNPWLHHLLHGHRQRTPPACSSTTGSRSPAPKRCGCIRPTTAGSCARKTARARSSRASSRDLVVLSDDYFDPTKVPDEAIKRLKSVLTVVDGKVVHDQTPELTSPPLEHFSDGVAPGPFGPGSLAVPRDPLYVHPPVHCKESEPGRTADRSRKESHARRTAARSTSGRARCVVASASIVLAGALTYANSLSGPFILDDQSTIADNQQIREWWRPSRKSCAEADTAIAGRPVVQPLVRDQPRIGGLAVRGYHIGTSPFTSSARWWRSVSSGGRSIAVPPRCGGAR